MPAVSWEEAHGSDRPTAGQVEASREALAPLIRWAEQVRLRQALDYTAAGLVAEALAHPPADPSAPLPQSQAARQHQASADAALLASRRNGWL